MAILSEGRLLFSFDPSYHAEKYDEWSFYRKQFQSTCGGAKAVDIICLSDNTCWLIEVKDYRQYKRTKPQCLGDEIAVKIRDTLSGLVAAKMNAKNDSERNFSKKSLNCHIMKVVLHLGQPQKKSKLRPCAIDPAAVKQSLKRLLSAIDTHPKVVDKANLHPNMGWTITDKEQISAK